VDPQDGGPLNVIVLSNVDSGVGVTGVESIAFAPNGDLWVGDYNNGRLVRLTKDQLTQSGEPVAASYIAAQTFDGGIAAGLKSLNNIYDMTFDSQGNLWAANRGNNPETIVKFSNPAGATATTLPDVVIVSDGGTFQGLNGLAFDAQGNLWAVSSSLNVVKLPNAMGLTGQSWAAPSVVLVSDGGAGDPVFKVANVTFDNSGSMWLLTYAFEAAGDAGVLARYDHPEQLSGTTMAPPAGAIFTGSPDQDTAHLQFNAPAMGLPYNP
jgi:hypothetical protein